MPLPSGFVLDQPPQVPQGFVLDSPDVPFSNRTTPFNPATHPGFVPVLNETGLPKGWGFGKESTAASTVSSFADRLSSIIEKQPLPTAQIPTSAPVTPDQLNIAGKWLASNPQIAAQREQLHPSYLATLDKLATAHPSLPAKPETMGEGIVQGALEQVNPENALLLTGIGEVFKAAKAGSMVAQLLKAGILTYFGKQGAEGLGTNLGEVSAQPMEQGELGKRAFGGVMSLGMMGAPGFEGIRERRAGLEKPVLPTETRLTPIDRYEMIKGRREIERPGVITQALPENTPPTPFQQRVEQELLRQAALDVKPPGASIPFIAAEREGRIVPPQGGAGQRFDVTQTPERKLLPAPFDIQQAIAEAQKRQQEPVRSRPLILAGQENVIGQKGLEPISREQVEGLQRSPVEDVHGGASKDLTSEQQVIEAKNKEAQKKIADEFKQKTQGQTLATDLVPAIQLRNGQVIKAGAGEITHDDVLKANKVAKPGYGYLSPNRGFVDAQGKWYTRTEAAEVTGIKGTHPKGLDSMDLPRAKGRESTKLYSFPGMVFDPEFYRNTVRGLRNAGRDFDKFSEFMVGQYGETMKPILDQVYRVAMTTSTKQDFDAVLKGIEKRQGSGLNVQIGNKGEAGSIPNPIPKEVHESIQRAREKLEPVFNKAVEKTGDFVHRTVDKIFNYGVDKSIDETSRFLASKHAGYSLPRHVTANEDVANKAIAFGAANTAAPEYAKSLSMKVMGDKINDKAFRSQLGKVLTEDRLRALASQHREKGNDALANSVTHVMSDVEFDAALQNKDIAAAIDRFKKIIQPVAELQHTRLGGKLAPVGESTGAFVNLLNIFHSDSFEAAKQKIYGGGNILTRGIIGKSKFDQPAKGVAPGYVTDAVEMMNRMVTGNYRMNQLINWIESGVDAGVYAYGKAGEPVTVQGKEAVNIPVYVRGTPWGSKVIKNLWVRKDLAPEVTQLLNPSKGSPKYGAQLALDAATELQILGPTDFAFHLGNMFSSIIRSPGKAQNYYVDQLLRLPFVKQGDAIGRVGWSLYKIMQESPEVQSLISDLARIGAVRPHTAEYSSTLLAKLSGGVLDTGRWIRAVDKAGRLARSQMFDNLVKQGLTKDTVLDRREFVNQMGQYEARMMSPLMSWMRSYFSQFVVAGRTFNKNGVKSILLENDVRAASFEAYAKMKLSNALAITATWVVVPVALNMYFTKKPFGRPGTRAGMIDTGEDDRNGRPILIDLAKTDLSRRGARISGLESVINGMADSKPVDKTVEKALMDVFNGARHPWEGPFVRIGEATAQEYYKTRDPGASFKKGFQAVNPTTQKFFEKQESGERGGLKGVATSLGEVIGSTRGKFLTHTEALEKYSKKSVSSMSLTEREAFERKYKASRPPMTEEARDQSLITSGKANAERRKALVGQLSKETQEWLKTNKLFMPGFSNKMSLETMKKGLPGLPTLHGLSLGGKKEHESTELFLTDNEIKFFSSHLAKNIEEQVKPLLTEKAKTTSEIITLQKRLAEVHKEAEQQTKQELKAAIESGSILEQNNGKKKPQRFSIFSNQ